MATTLISVEEYLKTTYEPDAEYVDGVIEERAAAEEPHSAWHTALITFFGLRAREWDIRVRPSLRIKIGEHRYRISDIAILDAGAPLNEVTIVPPLAVFEILSPEDRLSRLLVRLANFESMDVKALYIVDPADNSFFRFSRGGLEAATEVVLKNRIIHFSEILDLLR